ncbi:hypothetical protein LWI28_010351 [Acer negundo]|uniref:Uncharacterized protein n=1 Tax=Acer negundo TaxID=4023 RepID=A0AAD5JK02_ACENE|nr:hypothetical protein LWI28_010351 [Acer negundo]
MLEAENQLETGNIPENKDVAEAENLTETGNVSENDEHRRSSGEDHVEHDNSDGDPGFHLDPYSPSTECMGMRHGVAIQNESFLMLEDKPHCQIPTIRGLCMIHVVISTIWGQVMNGMPIRTSRIGGEIKTLKLMPLCDLKMRL